MTTKAGVGYSQQVHSREAGIEATQAAMARAGVECCDLVIQGMRETRSSFFTATMKFSQ